jgi:multiple sugar transport system ATP-binding protein
MAEVTLNNVWKIYAGDVAAVRDVTFSVRDGEFLVLVGPSGCGKSTTLRMIAGLEEISKGQIAIAGRVINDVPPKDRDIAMVFQNYALYPHMTVRENMAFGLRLRKFPRAEIDKRVDNAAQILGLEPYLDRLPKALSGGQRQRVAMGRSIVRDPAVFLFDEPLSNLDAKMRVEMRKEILQLHKRLGSTMVYVTHDQVEAMTLGDRICIMSDGIIEQIGTPGEVFSSPSNLFVARFIGTPPMNIIEGVLRKQGAQFVFEAPPLKAALPAEWNAKIAALEGKPVGLGFRPRAFGVLSGDTPPPADASVFTGDLDVAEMLGEELLLHLNAGKNRFIVSCDPQQQSGAEKTVRVVPNFAKAHLFDMASGKNMTL